MTKFAAAISYFFSLQYSTCMNRRIVHVTEPFSHIRLRHVPEAEMQISQIKDKGITERATIYINQTSKNETRKSKLKPWIILNGTKALICWSNKFAGHIRVILLVRESSFFLGFFFFLFLTGDNRCHFHYIFHCCYMFMCWIAWEVIRSGYDWCWL